MDRFEVLERYLEVIPRGDVEYLAAFPADLSVRLLRVFVVESADYGTNLAVENLSRTIRVAVAARGVCEHFAAAGECVVWESGRGWHTVPA